MENYWNPENVSLSPGIELFGILKQKQYLLQSLKMNCENRKISHLLYCVKSANQSLSTHKGLARKNVVSQCKKQ